MTAHERFIALGWWLIEAKILYYRPDLTAGEEPYSDVEYDAREVEYKALAAQLNLPPTASDMVGVDLERPSVRLALTRINGSLK